MKSNSKSEYPRILVISNNSFSATSNNGKTLASFFKSFPSENIAQLYFNQEIPTDVYFKKFYRIMDLEIINSFYSNIKPGGTIESLNIQQININEKNNESLTSKFKKFNLFRIARELLWLTNRWNTNSLNMWLDEFSPEVIFLCAGDSGFAYDITKCIRRKYVSKLVVYITDDYILPRRTFSPFWWIRRNYIFKKMKKTIQESDLLVTISEEMRSTYKTIFGRDSILAMNMTESMYSETQQIRNNKFITLLYAGGLHFKRYETLNFLAKSIEQYNNVTKGKKVFLKIYSGTEPSEDIKRHLNIKGASIFCGSLNSTELKIELNRCDIPVHVESFDHKCIESTRLSVSTKIPEYLSLGKPILAIGPNEVASMKYLEDSAYCITKLNELDLKLKDLIENEELKQVLSAKALLKFKKNHKKNDILKAFTEKINNL